MKNLILFLCLIQILLINAQHQTKNIDSKISKVTVYFEGAQILRNANASFNSGKTELFFKGISPFLVKESLKVKGSGNFTILSVIHQNNYLLSQTKRDEIAILEANKRDLLDKKLLENNVLKVLENEEIILSKNQVVSGESNGLKTSELREAVDFHRARLLDLIKQKNELKQRIIAIDSSLNKNNKQLITLNAFAENSTSEVIVTVSNNNPINNAPFEISYYVQNAGWYANYDMRVKDVNNPVDLQFKANIFQQTGEDWKDVMVSISNGNPNESGVAPNLLPWYLRYNYGEKLGTYEYYGSLSGNTIKGVVSDELGPIAGANVVVKGTAIGTTTDFDGNFTINIPKPNSVIVVSYTGKKHVSVPTDSNFIKIKLDDDVIQGEEVVVMGVIGKKTKPKKSNTLDIETSIDYKPTSIFYEIKNPYTVLSDGKIYSADIITHTIPATFEYISIPKIEPIAYLSAKITNWQDLNLFDGEMNLYFEDAYLGKSLLNLANVSDTLDISLGKDKSINIERNRIKDFSSKKFLSNNKVEMRWYEIIVKNNKPYPIQLKVYDQLPISTNKEIIVENQEFDGATLNENTKEVLWDLKLSSKETKKLKLKYEVKYPKNKYLNLD